LQNPCSPNKKSFVENPQLVQKTMNKEDRYSHLVPMDPLLCKLSPYLCHTVQSIVIKNRKNDCIVWDGSTVTQPTDIVMNQVTPVAQEAPVTFGHVKSQIYMDIYNTGISYPTATILLGLGNTILVKLELWELVIIFNNNFYSATNLCLRHASAKCGR
jgi:hypothetical protein